jgi:hypothetical protein
MTWFDIFTATALGFFVGTLPVFSYFIVTEYRNEKHHRKTMQGLDTEYREWLNNNTIGRDDH